MTRLTVRRYLSGDPVGQCHRVMRRQGVAHRRPPNRINGHINIKRLKDLHGTGEMSARYCGKDTVYWTPRHTIFVTTNYLPRVDESDHGTWRRLALVEFPYRYRKPQGDRETGRSAR